MAATYDDEKSYRVRLNRPVSLGGITLRPEEGLTMTGAGLKSLDAKFIVDATAIEEDLHDQRMPVSGAEQAEEQAAIDKLRAERAAKR